jgi:hypothetical protein
VKAIRSAMGTLTVFAGLIAGIVVLGRFATRGFVASNSYMDANLATRALPDVECGMPIYEWISGPPACFGGSLGRMALGVVLGLGIFGALAALGGAIGGLDAPSGDTPEDEHVGSRAADVDN